MVDLSLSAARQVPHSEQAEYEKQQLKREKERDTLLALNILSILNTAIYLGNDLTEFQKAVIALCKEKL